MSGLKESIRDLGGLIAEKTKRRKALAAVAAAAVVIVSIVVLSLYGTNGTQENASEALKVGVHEQAAIVKLSEEAQKASGIALREAVPEPLDAPIEATAVIELNGDRVAKISARTSGRLVKIAASQGDAVKTGQALAWFDSPELGHGRSTRRPGDGQSSHEITCSARRPCSEKRSPRKRT
jgi:multidrug efflux pump subunit AcrA (membrane-fusion protein)